MEKALRISRAIILSMLLLITANCKKDVIIIEQPYPNPPTNQNPSGELPSVTTNNVTSISENSATGGGNVTNDGGLTVTAKGLCWSKNQNPTISDSRTTDGTGTGSFTSTITGLTTGSTYYFRAYATNSKGTAYGNQVTLTLTAANIPVVSTASVSSVTSSGAIGGGTVTSDGGAPVTARGLCWSINQNPTNTDSKTTDGTGLGSFTSTISGLNPGKTYYIRAYATNSSGSGYGNQVIITTQAVVPTITTTPISSITESSMISGGSITNDGGAEVTSRGVCWSTNQNPTVNDSKTNDGAGTSSFISTVTGLTSDVTYYLRAYAVNSMGVSYGQQVSAKTIKVTPTLTTLSPTISSETLVITGGNISSNGGYPITQRGVCWSINPGPTIDDRKTNDGTGEGNFTSNISGISNLVVNTTYYVRAYAINSKGISYGDERSFIININVPGPNITDVDGNLYRSVKIGTQIWMVENLKVTKYRNGNSIQEVSDNIAWRNLNSGAYCNFDNNLAHGNTYGKLYNYYAVADSRNICPTGWHVPTKEEWNTLINFLGGGLIAGSKLKEQGTVHWNLARGSNTSGFTALAGSFRGDNGFFYNAVKHSGWWWTSTEFNSTYTWSLFLGDDGITFQTTDNFHDKRAGHSVRCIKD